MDQKMSHRLSELLKNTGDMALKRRANNIIEGLDLIDGDRVLDVGCGDGYYLHLLSNLGIELKLEGTDFDKLGLSRAKINLNKNISLKPGDLMEKLPYQKEVFNKIVMSEVCEHLPNDVKGLTEVKRVMKTGGVLCVTVPCHGYPFLWDPINWLLESLFDTHIKSGFFAGLWNQHIRLYEVEEIKKAVERAGFKVEVARALTWWCLPFNHYIINIVARGLAHDAFSKNIKDSLSKYTTKPKRPPFLDIAFWLVNKLDRLNDLWSPANSGVAVFVKAMKIK